MGDTLVTLTTSRSVTEAALRIQTLLVFSDAFKLDNQREAPARLSAFMTALVSLLQAEK